MTLTKLPTAHAVPYGIVILQNNTPFFCEFGTNKLASIDPSTMKIREYILPAAGARSPCPSSTARSSTSITVRLFPVLATRLPGCRHNVRVEHHEGQPSIAFQRILPMELDDRFLLPPLQQEAGFPYAC